MNWTGGRLQQARRAKAGISAQQKAYFARARARLGNERVSRLPLDFLPFSSNATVQISENKDTKGIGLKEREDVTSSGLQKSGDIMMQTPQRSRKRAQMNEVNLQERVHNTRLVRVEACQSLSKRRSHVVLSPLSERKRKQYRRIRSNRSNRDETTSQSERAAIEKKRLELLKRADWLTPVSRKPLNIQFPRRKEREKVARRRKLNREDLERLRWRCRDQPKKISSSPKGLIHSLGDSISVRHGTEIHRTQRTQNPISISECTSSRTFLLPMSQGQSLSSDLQETIMYSHQTSTAHSDSPCSASPSQAHVLRTKVNQPLPSEISEESSWNPNFSSDYPRECSEQPDKDSSTRGKATSESSSSDKNLSATRQPISSAGGSQPLAQSTSAETKEASGGFDHSAKSSFERYIEHKESCDASIQTLDAGIGFQRVNCSGEIAEREIAGPSRARDAFRDRRKRVKLIVQEEIED